MRWPVLLVVACVVAASLFAAPSASAQGDELSKRDSGFIGKELLRLEIDDCPPRPPLDRTVLRRQIDEGYGRSVVLHLQGDYEGAVAELVVVYCLSQTDDALQKVSWRLLKDLGQAHERLLDYDRAIAYFERYVIDMPSGARPLNPGDPPPEDERRNLSARIQVLRALPARIQVATIPAGAQITFSDETGKRASERADDRAIEVTAGRYTMSVEMPGYIPVTREVQVRVGQPYAFFFPLERQRGRLRIQAVPPDGRIFLDDKLVALGSYDDEVAGGTYQVTVEAADRRPRTQAVEVVADRETRLTVRLEPPPQSGRRQLVITAGIAGAALGTVGLGATGNDLLSGVGFFGGLALGGLGAWYGIPESIPVGQSSYIITSSLIGLGEGMILSSALIDNPSDNVIGSAGLIGMVSGGVLASLTAARLDLDAGDAALLNSGALWGSIFGGVFVEVFQSSDTVDTVLLLGGLNIGVVTGALLGRSYEISRGHAALIDLAGLAGLATGVAVENGLAGELSYAEGQAHFALGGAAIGLIAGAYFTRDMDVRKPAAIRPRLGQSVDVGGRRVVQVGVGGEF